MHRGRAHAFGLEFELRKLHPRFPSAGSGNIAILFLFFLFFLEELFLQSRSKPAVGFYYKSENGNVLLQC